MLVACPTNFTYEQSVRGCYYLVTDRLPYSGASYRCITLHPDAHLVAINSDQEQIVVAGLLYHVPGKYLSTFSPRLFFQVVVGVQTEKGCGKENWRK